MRALLSSSWIWKGLSFLFATLAVISFGNLLVARYAATLEEANTQLVLRQHVAIHGAALATDDSGRTTGFVRFATDRAREIDGQLAVLMQASDAGAAYLGIALLDAPAGRSDDLVGGTSRPGAARIFPVAGQLVTPSDEASTAAFPQIAGSDALPVLRVEPGFSEAVMRAGPHLGMWFGLLFTVLAIAASLRAAMPAATSPRHKATTRPRNARQVMAMRRFDPVAPQETLEEPTKTRRTGSAKRLLKT